MHPDNLVLNTRAVGIRGAVTGRDEKKREQLVLQEGSEALEMQAVTLGLGWANSLADERQREALIVLWPVLCDAKQQGWADDDEIS